MNSKNLILVSLVILVSFFMSCEEDIMGVSEVREQILQEWRCDEYGGTNDSYEIKIRKDDLDEAKFYIDNFHNLQAGEVYAVITGMTFNVPTQILDINQVAGSGKIASDFSSIDLSYTVDGKSYTAVLRPNTVSLNPKQDEISR